MNERMIELMNEANNTAGFTFSMDQAKPVHDLMEKFAELIVKETMQVVANRLPSNVYLDVADAVIEHYGDK